MIGDVFRYLIQGIPLGCIYGLVAVGLVLTYKTSGVFNLAFGAQAFLSSAIYNALRTDEQWSIVPAAVVAILVTAPIVGIVLDRCLFRFLRGAVWQVKLVTALGLLTGLPEVIKVAFGDQPVINPPGLAPDPHWTIQVGDQAWSANEFITVIATVTVVIGLALLFRYTALGLQMRGIVESPRMVELAGVDSERVGMRAWILSSLMAGLAGVLLAPLYGQLDANSFTLLLVVAIVAAVVGRLTSLPIAFAGAIGLGIAQQVVAGEIDPNSRSEFVRVLYQGLRGSLPFVVLFLFLVLSPAIRNRREATDPLRGVDPPPPNLAVTYHDQRLRRINMVVFPTFVVAVILATQTWVLGDSALSPLWVSRFTDGIVLAVTLLSITVITGLAGQVSLAQASFSGLGVFVTAQLAAAHGFPMIWAMLAGALLAAVIGALIAIPSLRLGGIYLTLATLATALFADAIVFHLKFLTGGTQGIQACLLPSDRNCIKPANAFGVDVSSDRSFFLFALAVFALVGLLVILVRKGTTGRYFAAIRGSEVAAPSIGINPTAARIKVFALSAGIAGLGGGLYAMYYSGVQSNIGTIYEGDLRYNTLFGFLLVVLVVSLGARTVDGAVNAALGFVLFPLLISDELHLPENLAVIGFAFGAITYARHPEGIVEFQKLRSIRANIGHRAVAARTRALEVAGRLRPRRDPTVAVAMAAAPALLLLAAFAATGSYLGTGEVLAYALALYVVVAVVAVRAQRELRETGAEPLTLPSLLLLASTVVGLFIVVPDAIGRLARRKYVPVDATWITGVFPTFLLGVNLFVQARRGGPDDPSSLGWGLVLFVGTVALLGWLSTVLWGIREYRVAIEEQAAPSATQPEPAAALAAAPPGAG